MHPVGLYIDRCSKMYANINNYCMPFKRKLMVITNSPSFNIQTFYYYYDN